MRLLMLAVLAASTGIQLRAVAAQTNRPYPDVFRALRDTMSAQFFDPSFGGINWDSLTRTFEARVAAATSDAAFLGLVQDMLRSLRTSHLFLAAPDTATHFGIAAQLAAVGNRRVVTSLCRFLALISARVVMQCSPRRWSCYAQRRALDQLNPVRRSSCA
jgi:hypothetical protein